MTGTATGAPALAAGYSGVGFDNLWLYNGWKRCGHFSTSRRWVQQYSGLARDANYAASVLAWAPAMRDRVHQFVVMRNRAHSGGKSFVFGFNYSFTPAVNLSIQAQLVDTADLWLDECGVTRCGRGAPPAASWAAIHSMIHGFHGCYFSNNEMNTSDAAMRGWALANYLLERGSCSYLSMERPQQYGTLLDFPEYHLDPGLPLEGAHLVREAPAGFAARARLDQHGGSPHRLLRLRSTDVARRGLTAAAEPSADQVRISSSSSMCTHET